MHEQSIRKTLHVHLFTSEAYLNVFWCSCRLLGRSGLYMTFSHPFLGPSSPKSTSVPGRRGRAVGGRRRAGCVIGWGGRRRAESLSWRLCGQQHTLLTGPEWWVETGWYICTNDRCTHTLSSCPADSEMHCVYLKSVRSPAVQGKFKMSYRNHHNMDIFSQVYNLLNLTA